VHKSESLIFILLLDPAAIIYLQVAAALQSINPIIFMSHYSRIK